VVVLLRRPTSDTVMTAAAAIGALSRIFRRGIDIAKADVMPKDIQPATLAQGELELDASDVDGDRGRLMQALDATNDRWGRRTMREASGQGGAAPRDWTGTRSGKHRATRPSGTSCPPRKREPRVPDPNVVA